MKCVKAYIACDQDSHQSRDSYEYNKLDSVSDALMNLSVNQQRTDPSAPSYPSKFIETGKQI